MMVPDYTHWLGTYWVAQSFYIRFIPELERLAKEGMASNDPKKQEAAKALIAKMKEDSLIRFIRLTNYSYLIFLSLLTYAEVSI